MGQHVAHVDVWDEVAKEKRVGVAYAERGGRALGQQTLSVGDMYVPAWHGAYGSTHRAAPRMPWGRPLHNSYVRRAAPRSTAKRTRLAAHLAAVERQTF